HLERTLDALFGRVDAQVEVIVGHVERGLFRTERPTRIERVVATRARRKHEPQQQRQSRYFPAKTVDAHVGDVMPGRWKYSGTPATRSAEFRHADNTRLPPVYQGGRPN